MNVGAFLMLWGGLFSGIQQDRDRCTPVEAVGDLKGGTDSASGSE